MKPLADHAPPPAPPPSPPRAGIAARAPLRLGLAGGGTDLSPFCDLFGGAVLNASIDLHAHARVAASSDGRWHFAARDLGIVETHACPDEAAAGTRLPIHAAVLGRLLRDVGRLKARRPPLPLLVETHVDVPPGSGLGGSSALVVALVACVAARLGHGLDPPAMAPLAYEIERLDLRLPGGRQDAYAAALGGVNFLAFLPGERVEVERLRLPAHVRTELEASLLICATGESRDAAPIIAEQMRAMSSAGSEALSCLHAMKQDAIEMRRALQHGDVPGIGRLLARSWAAKKRTASGVATARIEQLHDIACRHGATGGKVSGAGGGGHMLFVVPKTHRDAVKRALAAAAAAPRAVRLTARGVEIRHETR